MCMNTVAQNGYSLATFIVETESRISKVNSKQKHASNGKRWPLAPFPFLAPWPYRPPSRRRHAQSLLGPSFHDPRTPHVFESHPERAAPLSRRDDERWHAIGSHSTLALRLYLAACNPSSSCRVGVLDHLCSNLSQSFQSCWISETRRLNLCVCFTFSPFAFACCKKWTLALRPCLHFGQYHHSDSTIIFTSV